MKLFIAIYSCCFNFVKNLLYLYIVLLLYDQFQRDGYAVLEDFLTEDEVIKLKAAGTALATDMPDSVPCSQFSTATAPQVKRILI
jgi:hypothetical protein